MISKLPPSKLGLIIVFIISYANIEGFTVFETFLGPIIQYKGNYIRDPNDLNCSYVYILYAAFGFASLLAVLIQAKFESSRESTKMIKKFGPRAQILVCLGIGILGTVIMTTASLSTFQIFVGFTLVLISFNLCKVAIYSLFYRITGRHNNFYISIYILVTGLMWTFIPRIVYWRLEQEADRIMINAWVKYIMAVVAVVLGQNFIAPHKMWQIEKTREDIKEIDEEH